MFTFWHSFWRLASDIQFFENMKKKATKMIGLICLLSYN